MDVFPKFIIEDNKLIISKCTYHKELVTDKEKVQGGGWFIYDHKFKSFTLYGSSHDFGEATIENIKKCILDDNVFTNTYLTHSIANKYKFIYKTDSNELIDLN